MLSILLQILVVISAISSLTLSTQTDFSNTNTCCRARLPSVITFQIKTIGMLPHSLSLRETFTEGYDYYGLRPS